jgi:glucose-6-phosphate 1-dehydrogenase
MMAPCTVPPRSRPAPDVGQAATLLVLFGATGDLALRMLLPSLYGLQRDGLLPAGLRILGSARAALDDAGFRDLVARAIAQRIPTTALEQASMDALLQRLAFQPAAIDDDDAMAALTARIAALRSGDVVYHLSTAPRWYPTICERLGSAGLAGPGTRVLLEKPIGHDLASSIAINDGVAARFDEDRVFRVDHYLGKEGVQNLLALRFGNALFEPLWHTGHIEQVQITVAETVGVEGRGGYYDESGALRDMVQNHLMQLLCLVAMEPPSQFDPVAVRNEKLKVLRSLRPIRGAAVANDTVAGQYGPGAIDGVAVPGYGDEIGHGSGTETFVAVRAHIDNWRWSGVPFYLRTGKRQPRRCSEIYLQFRAVPHSIFAGNGATVQPNALVIQLQPQERISMHLMNKTPGLDRTGVRLSQVALDLDRGDAFGQDRSRIAYERLYLDALEGNGTLFVRRDEVEAAWTWIDGIAAGWREHGGPPRPYPAGTAGPSSAVALTERHGHSWRD